jgi:hypothetical protein
VPFCSTQTHGYTLRCLIEPEALKSDSLDHDNDIARPGLAILDAIARFTEQPPNCEVRCADRYRFVRDNVSGGGIEALSDQIDVGDLSRGAAG